jgi:alanine dehydrogenase
MEAAIANPPAFAIRMKSDMLYWVKDGDLHTEEKFCVQPEKFCGLVFLFSTANGEPLAIINDGFIQHARVAATSCLAAKYLARTSSSVLGIYGSGGMARSHAAGFCAVRPIKKIKVFSPTPEHREAFANEMRHQLGVEVQVLDYPEGVAEDVDILAACTDSVEPVIKTSHLRPGLHISAVLPSELEPGVIEGADVIVRHLDKRAQMYIMPKVEKDYHGLSKSKLADFEKLYSSKQEDIPTLADLVSGRCAGRTDEKQITFFDNVPGSGLQFAAVAYKVYELAKKQGKGRELPTDWFLQDIRD